MRNDQLTEVPTASILVEASNYAEGPGRKTRASGPDLDDDVCLERGDDDEATMLQSN